MNIHRSLTVDVDADEKHIENDITTIYEILIQTELRTQKYICNGKFDGYPFWNLGNVKSVDIQIHRGHISRILASKLHELQNDQGYFYKKILDLYNNLNPHECVLVNYIISDEME